jgi:hypothetical protein
MTPVKFSEELEFQQKENVLLSHHIYPERSPREEGKSVQGWAWVVRPT